MTLAEHISYIKLHYSKHSNYSVALSVLNRLLYIEKNQELIQDVIKKGKKSIRGRPNAQAMDPIYGYLRDDHSSPFHLNFYFANDNPILAAKNAQHMFQYMNTAICNGLDYINKHQKREIYYNTFLMKLMDSDIGCMDMMFRDALSYLEKILREQAQSLDTLYQELAIKALSDSFYSPKNKTLTFIQRFTPYYGQVLEAKERPNHKLKINIHNLIRDYNTVYGGEFLDANQLIAVLFSDYTFIAPSEIYGRYRFVFNDETTASIWFIIVKEHLVTPGDNAIKSQVVKRIGSNYGFSVTVSQFEKLNTIAHTNLTEPSTPLNIKSTTKSDNVARNPLDKYQFLENLKRSVNSEKWNSLGRGIFFRKIPDGLGRLRKDLKLLTRDNSDKIYDKVKNILKEKQKPYRGLGKRELETSTFYHTQYRLLMYLEDNGIKASGMRLG